MATRKQAGVIYRAYKEGKLPNVTEENISDMYYHVNHIGDYDYMKNHYESCLCTMIKNAVTAIFNNDYSKADYEMKAFCL
jgi:hypothetical protein